MVFVQSRAVVLVLLLLAGVVSVGITGWLVDWLVG